MDKKSFSKSEINDLISNLRRITKKTKKIYLRECYIESLLETQKYHFEYINFICGKDKVGTYYLWKSWDFKQVLRFQYQCSKSTFTKCIIIYK